MNRVVLGVLAAILLVTVAWWFAFYSPANEQQAALEAETDQLITQQGQLRNQLAQLNDIREREVEIRADLSRLEQFIPTTPGQASLIRQSQLAADASGVDFLTLAFEEPEAVDGAPSPAQAGLVLGQIAVTGSVEGGYFQIVDFLRRLEVEVTRAILVDSVQIEEGEDGFPQLQATFTARVFALVTQPVDPNAPPPADPNATPTEGPEPADGAAPAGEGAEAAPADAGDQTSSADQPRDRTDDAPVEVASR